MSRERFKLLGHDNPLGYPAPVVPVGLLDNYLVAVYASDRATAIDLDSSEHFFVRHNESIKEALKEFDYLNDRLFAFDTELVNSYAIDYEAEYFTHLLRDRTFAKNNPFLRLALAKATNNISLLIRELGACVSRLLEVTPHLTDTWYAQQIHTLSQQLNPLDQFLIPETWKVLLDILDDEFQGLEWIQAEERLEYRYVTDEEPDEARAPVDIAIITTLEEELDSVLAKLPNVQRVVAGTDDVRVYYRSELPIVSEGGSTTSYSIAVVSLLDISSAGPIGIVREIIHHLRPKNVIWVGIAGGIGSSGVELGDVIVSDQVINYEIPKIAPLKENYNVHHADPSLLATLKEVRSDDWQQLIQQQRPGLGSPRSIIGPLAVSASLISKKDIKRLMNNWPNLLGLDMEDTAAASASHQVEAKTGFLIIRGVSDLADQSVKSENIGVWRSYACDVAASYTMALLKKGLTVSLKEEANLEEDTSPSLHPPRAEDSQGDVKERSIESPRDINSLMQLANTYQLQKLYGEAETVLREVLNTAPEHLDALIELSKIYQRQRRWTDAEEMLLNALRIDPTILQARIELSKIYQQQNRWRKAEDILLESLNIDPQELHARTELSKIYQRQNRWREAEGILLESLNIDPGQLNPHIELSKIYQRQNRWREAEDVLLKTLQIEPDILQARIELNKIYQRMKRWKDAENILLEALHLDPAQLSSRTELSKVYQHTKRWKDAEDVLLDALQIDPENLQSRIELSNIYQRQKRFEDAEDILIAALKVDPRDIQIRRKLSGLYRAQAKFNEAEGLLRECLQIDPNDVHSLLDLGKIYSREPNRYQEAELIFRQIIQKDINNIFARLELASLYVKMKKYAAREDILFEIYEITPEDVRTLVALAEVFKRFRKYRIALQLLVNALAIQDSDLLIVCELIKLYMLLRDKKNVELYVNKGQEILDSDPYNRFRERFTKFKVELDEKTTLLKLNEVGILVRAATESFIEQGNFRYPFNNQVTINNRVKENDKVFFATYKIGEEIVADFIEPFFESITQLRQLK